MTTIQIPGSAIVLNATGWATGTWYEREALMSIHRGWCQAITGRNDDDLYLLRVWLTSPAPSRGGDRFESGDSLLLHYFVRGDDDQALHDHPWDFRTTILVGGYIEHLPPEAWRHGHRITGPAWNERTEFRCERDQIDHRAEDLHCVGAIQTPTWTLMRTGPRRREWGFHPPARLWTPYREFLEARRQVAGA